MMARFVHSKFSISIVSSSGHGLAGHSLLSFC
jgi:hypothetical protein